MGWKRRKITCYLCSYWESISSQPRYCQSEINPQFRQQTGDKYMMKLSERVNSDNTSFCSVKTKHNDVHIGKQWTRRLLLYGLWHVQIWQAGRTVLSILRPPSSDQKKIDIASSFGNVGNTCMICFNIKRSPTSCPDCVYVFHIIITIGYYCVYSSSIFVFVIEIRRISCEVGVEFLSIIYIKFRLKRINKFITRG